MMLFYDEILVRISRVLSFYSCPRNLKADYRAKIVAVYVTVFITMLWCHIEVNKNSRNFTSHLSTLKIQFSSVDFFNVSNNIIEGNHPGLSSAVSRKNNGQNIIIDGVKRCNDNKDPNINKNNCDDSNCDKVDPSRKNNNNSGNSCNKQNTTYSGSSGFNNGNDRSGEDNNSNRRNRYSGNDSDSSGDESSGSGDEEVEIIYELNDENYNDNANDNSRSVYIPKDERCIEFDGKIKYRKRNSFKKSSCNDKRRRKYNGKLKYRNVDCDYRSSDSERENQKHSSDSAFFRSRCNSFDGKHSDNCQHPEERRSLNNVKRRIAQIDHKFHQLSNQERRRNFRQKHEKARNAKGILLHLENIDDALHKTPLPPIISRKQYLRYTSLKRRIQHLHWRVRKYLFRPLMFFCPSPEPEPEPGKIEIYSDLIKRFLRTQKRTITITEQVLPIEEKPSMQETTAASSTPTENCLLPTFVPTPSSVPPQTSTSM